MRNTKMCYFCDEFDHSEANCLKKWQLVYYGKYCSICKRYGHLEYLCPLVDTVWEQSYAEKVKERKKSVTGKVVCNFCNKSNHSETNCLQKIQYYRKYCHYCKIHGHFRVDCPLLEPYNKQKTYEYYSKYCRICKEFGHEQPSQSCYSKDAVKMSTKALKFSKLCNFCYEFDHTESDCIKKIQYEYFGKYCRYCEEFGHLKDTCQSVINAAKNLQKQDCKNTIHNSCKKEKLLNNIADLEIALDNMKICSVCHEIGHSETECFVKVPSKYYSKYCYYCKENSHWVEDCPIFDYYSATPRRRSLIKNILLNESIYEKTKNYSKICSVHYICEKCHCIYSYKFDKYYYQSISEIDRPKFRYCIICGTKGLVEECYFMNPAAC